MINKNIRNQMHYDTVVFDNPAFDHAIIGMTIDGRAIYVLELMVSELVEDDEISEEEALEFIEYNTIRTLPYITGKAPIILADTFMLLQDE